MTRPWASDDSSVSQPARSSVLASYRGAKTARTRSILLDGMGGSAAFSILSKRDNQRRISRVRNLAASVVSWPGSGTVRRDRGGPQCCRSGPRRTGDCPRRTSGARRPCRPSGCRGPRRSLRPWRPADARDVGWAACVSKWETPARTRWKTTQACRIRPGASTTANTGRIAKTPIQEICPQMTQMNTDGRKEELGMTRGKNDN